MSRTDSTTFAHDGRPNTKSILTMPAYGVWLMGAVAFLTLVCVQTPRVEVLVAADLPLPKPTGWLLGLGNEIRTPIGMASAAGILLLTAAPFVLGARGPKAARIYGFLALLGLVAAGAAWWFLVQPVGVALHQLTPSMPGK